MESFQVVPGNLKPLTVQNVVKFHGDLKARDKILRLAQYFTKFLVYRMLQNDPKSDLGKRINLLSKGIGLHRKAFKFGNWLDEYQKLKELLESGKYDVKTNLSIVLRSCMGVFVALDNLVWLVSLKVLDLDKDFLKGKAYRYRLTCAILSTIIGALDMDKQNKVIAKCQTTDEKRQAEEKQGKNAVGMVKNVMDVITYSNSAGYIAQITGSGLNDGTVGLIGSVSSIAALYSIWIK